MKSHEDKNSVNVSPISIFLMADMEYSIMIIIICYQERKMMTNEKQCMVVQMDKTLSYNIL